eukprot:gene30257-39475_t
MKKLRREIKGKELRFVHITKNAGTSIEEVSTSGSFKYGNCSGWGRHDEGLRELGCSVPMRPLGISRSQYNCFWHTPPKYFDKADLRQWLKSYDLFIVVRNPFTRVLSEFYCEFGGPRPERSVVCQTVSGFNQWIHDQLTHIQAALHSGAIMHGHWCPQYLYLTDKDGNRIVAEANIVHFENLLEEFESLMKRYNCPYTLKGAKKMLASVNSTSAAEATSGGTVKKKFTVADLSSECVKLIQQVYAQDFQFFKYDADPLRSVDLPGSAASTSTSLDDDAVVRHSDTTVTRTSPESDSTTTTVAFDPSTSSKKRPHSEIVVQVDS